MYPATLHNNPEDRDPKCHCCWNFKSCFWPS